MAVVFMQKIVEKVYNSPAIDGLKKRAEARADVIFDTAVAVMKDEFDKHEVTKEIKEGIKASNDSKTLRGGLPTENLFSFIGFNAGSDPTKSIEPFLDPSNKHGPQMSFVGKDRRGISIRFQFKVKSPDEKEVWKATPLPWPGFSSMSWAKKIETGIQGFHAFIARKMGSPSRSGGGIQATVGGKKEGAVQTLRGASYVPPTEGYLQTIFKNFLERVKKVTK